MNVRWLGGLARIVLFPRRRLWWLGADVRLTIWLLKIYFWVLRLTFGIVDWVLRAMFWILIRIYQFLLSQILHLLGGPAAGCRFEPSCSRYGLGCFERFWTGKALWLTIWRVVRCNPFCKGGYDPVPPRKGRRRGAGEPAA